MSAIVPTKTFSPSALYFEGVITGLRSVAKFAICNFFLNKAENFAKERSYTIPFPVSLVFLQGKQYLLQSAVQEALKHALFEPTQEIIIRNIYSTFFKVEGDPAQNRNQGIALHFSPAAVAVAIKVASYFLLLFCVQKIYSSRNWPLVPVDRWTHFTMILLLSSLNEFGKASHRRRVCKEVSQQMAQLGLPIAPDATNKWHLIFDPSVRLSEEELRSAEEKYHIFLLDQLLSPPSPGQQSILKSRLYSGEVDHGSLTEAIKELKTILGEPLAAALSEQVPVEEESDIEPEIRGVLTRARAQLRPGSTALPSEKEKIFSKLVEITRLLLSPNPPQKAET